jgi:hypothetical protein
MPDRPRGNFGFRISDFEFDVPLPAFSTGKPTVGVALSRSPEVPGIPI